VTERERHKDGGGLLRDRSDFEEWASQVANTVEERRLRSAPQPSPEHRTFSNQRWWRMKLRLHNAFLSH